MDIASLSSKLYDRGGLKTVFDHAKNAVVATLIIAAGLEASTSTAPVGLFGIMDPRVSGYVVAAVGYGLILLNCGDGLRQLSALKHRLAWQAVLGLVYLLLTIRIVELTIRLRTGGC